MRSGRTDALQARNVVEIADKARDSQYDFVAGFARDMHETEVETVKRSVTINWTLRENVRVQLRGIVKILRSCVDTW